MVFAFPDTTKMLFLPPIPTDLDVATLPIVYKSVATIGKKSCEQAGKAYHNYCLRASGVEAVDETKKTRKGRSESQDDDARRRKEWEEKNGGKLNIEEAPEENLYEVLGIGHIGFNASFKQIKKAYQKQILIHHPDKKAGGEKQKVVNSDGEEEERQDPVFLAIQKAWDILGNEKKRRGYDSTFEFDDSIPGGSETIETDEDFLELYGPVFERNGRFSQKKPVPMLGHTDTDVAAVRKFYQWWNRFESWREFVKDDEFKDGDIDDASCREEKRWMISQNEKIRKKLKKKEYERIASLVERAQKCDPRLIRARNAEKEQKERAQRERREAKLAEENAAKEKAEKEKKEREERERALKEKNDEERRLRQSRKKKLKKKIKLLLKQVGSACNCLNIEPAEKLKYFEKIDDITRDLELHEDLDFICEAFGDFSEDNLDKNLATHGLEVVELSFQGWKEGNLNQKAKAEELRAARLEEEKKKLKAKQDAKVVAEWSPDELSSLAKALKKYPGGVRKRWELVAEYVNINVSQAEGKDRTKDQCLKKVEELGKSMQTKKDENIVGNKQAFEDLQKKVKARTARPENSNPEKAAITPPAPEAENIPAEWSQEEQSKLEAALKQYPASLEKNERWRKISAAVPTRSKKECVTRYKYLRAQVLAKKKAVQA